jgi:sugar phosphate isomerase/epimerase
MRRRSLLQAGTGLATQALGFGAPQARRAVQKGRIRQSACAWCFTSTNPADKKWDLAKLCETVKALGGESVELVGPDAWPTLQKYGLKCAITGNGMPGPAFMRGVNNPRYHEEVIARTTEMLGKAADAGVPNVIAFTGFKWRDAADPKSGEIPLGEGAENSVRALKELAARAARRNVTLCLEQLNTRDSSHPMKGHPGYQGDDIDYCADIVRTVGSPNCKLLFDIYHVQVMNGDVMRRIREMAPIIGHVHTAGNPGRAELDDRQEIAYAPLMRALLEAGYKGFVGHEFIPTRDPLEGLRQAVALCDV